MRKNNGIDAPGFAFLGTITSNLGLFRTLVGVLVQLSKIQGTPLNNNNSIAGKN